MSFSLGASHFVPQVMFLGDKMLLINIWDAQRTDILRVNVEQLNPPLGGGGLLMILCTCSPAKRHAVAAAAAAAEGAFATMPMG